jgi:PAS domain-containing protein
MKSLANTSKLATMRARDIPKFLELFISVLRGKAPKPFEATWQGKDGSTYLTEVHVTLMKRDGKTSGILAIARDITERKKAEKLNMETQQKFAALFKGNPEATVCLDPDFRILDINPRFASLFGYALNQIKGKPE